MPKFLMATKLGLVELVPFLAYGVTLYYYPTWDVGPNLVERYCGLFVAIEINIHWILQMPSTFKWPSEYQIVVWPFFFV